MTLSRKAQHVEGLLWTAKHCKPACGTIIEAGQAFCPGCGRRKEYTMPAASVLRESTRIVKAVNAFESPVARAERAVVRAAMRTDWSGDLTKLVRAVDGLVAARAKAAKKGAK